MSATCVVGLQWGDEAKGKVVDLLTAEHDVVVRFNGGSNAGHTVVAKGKTFKLSLVPSGIVHENLECVIGNGVVVNPESLLKEVDSLREKGVAIDNRLFLSDRAHVIFPYHMEQERLMEEGAGDAAIGTTRRGVGPCYSDKAGRIHAVRVIDWMDPKRLRERLNVIVPAKNALLKSMSLKALVFEVESLAKQYDGLANLVRPMVCDTFWKLQQKIVDQKRILLEAAQGSLLDIDHGTYPFVTSSSSSACGIASGCGIPTRHVDRIIGVVKAYSTRVGAGPFPTELLNSTGELIRNEGREFGTVTGRPRRCGWFDAVAARYAALFNGVDAIAVMLLDVLSKFDELQICEAYEIDGERTTAFPVDAERLARAKPILTSFPGWNRPIQDCRKLADLPVNAMHYVDRIAELLQAPVSLISIGPDRDQTIRLD